MPASRGTGSASLGLACDELRIDPRQLLQRGCSRGDRTRVRASHRSSACRASGRRRGARGLSAAPGAPAVREVRLGAGAVHLPAGHPCRAVARLRSITVILLDERGGGELRDVLVLGPPAIDEIREHAGQPAASGACPLMLRVVPVRCLLVQAGGQAHVRIRTLPLLRGVERADDC